MAVIPSGLSLFCISLLETMVSINVADKYTATDSEQDRVFYGQGVSNLAGGLMGGMGSTGLAHASLHSLRMGGVTSASVFFAGLYMLMIVALAWPAVAMVPLGATMGVTLYLVWSMSQMAPVSGLFLKCIPNRCMENNPFLMNKKLATPDLFSTFITSIFALCASTYSLAGYLIGLLCYACDPIGHGEYIKYFWTVPFRIGYIFNKMPSSCLHILTKCLPLVCICVQQLFRVIMKVATTSSI